MKKTKDNLEHRIQLKEDEIKRYELVIRNYPPRRMEINGKPYLAKLQQELNELKQELAQNSVS